MKKKVIIDCDPGVDDALALIFALHSPGLDVKAITAVNGNVPLAQGFENIKKILTLVGPRPKPLIAKGEEAPLKGRPVYAYAFHGKGGLGQSKLTQRPGVENWGTSPLHAGRLIPRLARRHPKEITLIALGPLTNLAWGLQEDPEGMAMLKDVVIMGGAVRTKGNVTPFAEFNIYVDPLAAARVLRAGWPLTLVPLDVTHRAFLTPGMMEEKVKPFHNPFSQFVGEVTGYRPSTRRFHRGRRFFYLHDPLAVGVALHPRLVKKERLSLAIETRKGKHYGQIKEREEETREHVPGDKKVDVCLEVDSEKFLKLFLPRVCSKGGRPHPA
jgi:inosine-uridine nucleoside N-ribohydrolase